MATIKKGSSTKTTKKSTAKVKAPPIPKGYHSITPYLIVKGGLKAIEFYKKAFGAKRVICMEHKGKVAHAELTIGDSKIMLGDENKDMKALAPKYFGGSPISIHVYVKNVDTVVDRALKAGAKLIRPVENQFYGDRSGAVEDPFGHTWYIATHIEELTMKEVKKRALELYGKK